jgi:hypothetical protein
MKLHIVDYFSTSSIFSSKPLDASILKVYNGVMMAYFTPYYGNLTFNI